MQAGPDTGEEGGRVQAEAMREQTLRRRSLGVNKEPCHWSRVSMTKGRGEKCENTAVTTVSKHRYSPYSQRIDISCGWEERIK